MRLLLTRPGADAERTAARLRAGGHDVVIAPLVRIEAVADARLDGGPWEAVLVTSANAAVVSAHVDVERIKDFPVLAVGRRSAAAMRAAGFVDVTSADGAVNELAEFVVAKLPQRTRLLYLAGAERSGDLAGELRARGFTVNTVIIYRAKAAAAFDERARAELRTPIDGVLHFSRRSAQAYLKAVRETAGMEPMLAKAIQFCISARVAQPLAEAGAADIRIAVRPDEAAILELIPHS